MKSSFFEKINMIEKPFTKLTKRREKIQINKIRDDKGDTTKIPVKIRESLGNTSKNLYFNKLEKSRKKWMSF
jgi:hypothetical protein